MAVLIKYIPLLPQSTIVKWEKQKIIEMQSIYQSPLKLLSLYFVCVVATSFGIEILTSIPNNERAESIILAEKEEVATYTFSVPRIIKIEQEDITGLKKVISSRRNVNKRREARKANRQNRLLATTATAPPIAKIPVKYQDLFDNLPSSSVRSTILSEAKKYLGLRYIWGGTSTKGFDCSGFTSYVLAQNGVDIARSSRFQAKQGNSVDLKKVKTGDLIFFSRHGKRGRINHVAMVVDNKKDGVYIIHSTNRGVVVDNLTQCNYWRPKIHHARDVITRESI